MRTALSAYLVYLRASHAPADELGRLRHLADFCGTADDAEEALLDYIVTHGAAAAIGHLRATCEARCLTASRMLAWLQLNRLLPASERGAPRR
jgi:hypothetical protein